MQKYCFKVETLFPEVPLLAPYVETFVYLASDVEAMEQAHRSELGSIVTEHEERCAAASKCIKELKEESKKLYDEAVDENRKICLALDKVRQAHREEIAKREAIQDQLDKSSQEEFLSLLYQVADLKKQNAALTARCKRREEATRELRRALSNYNPDHDALKEAGQ